MPTIDPASLLLLAPASAALVASAAAAGYALRGRRVDDHPVCRRCGYDLYGKPAASTACAECGADLTRRRAVRAGRRRPRRGMAVAMAMLALLSAAWLAFAGWTAARSADWQRRKPVWWLVRDCGARDPAARAAAVGELGRRLADGRLTAPQAVRVADALLDAQADPSRPWDPAMGDLLYAMRDAGRLPPDQWRRYARQAARIELRAGPALRRGEPLTLRFDLPPPRAAGKHALAVTWEPLAVRLGDAVAHRDELSPCSIPVVNGVPDRMMWDVPLDPAAITAAEDGAYVVRVPVRVRIDDTGPRGFSTPAVEEETTLTAAVTLASPRAVLEPAHDRSLRPAVEKAITISVVGLWPGRGGAADPPVVLEVGVNAPPVAVAMAVLVRTAAGEYRIGNVQCRAGQSVRVQLMGEVPGVRGGGRVNVVLRPEAQTAALGLDGVVYRGGDIVLNDLPLGPNPAAAATNTHDPVDGRAPRRTEGEP